MSESSKSAAMRRQLNARIRTQAKVFRVTIPSTGSVSYDGIKTQVQLDRLYLDPGKLDDYMFSVTFSQWIFRETTLPANGSLVKGTDDLVTYRVLGTSTDGSDVSVRLDLGAKHERSR